MPGTVAHFDLDAGAVLQLGGVFGIRWRPILPATRVTYVPKHALQGDEEVVKKWLVNRRPQLVVAGLGDAVCRQRPADGGRNHMLRSIPLKQVRLSTEPAAARSALRAHA